MLPKFSSSKLKSSRPFRLYAAGELAIFPVEMSFIHTTTILNESDVKVSVNVRSTTPQPIIEVGNLSNIDIVEINCHCRQKEISAVGCGEVMLKSSGLGDFISEVADNVKSEVSVKIRANVDDVDTLSIANLIEDAGADYLHIDAMKKGVFEADWDLLYEICDNVNINVIGNNSVNSAENLCKMIQTGVDGFSIARAIISTKLNFDII